VCAGAVGIARSLSICVTGAALSKIISLLEKLVGPPHAFLKYSPRGVCEYAGGELQALRWHKKSRQNFLAGSKFWV
jgi:hypothetical protein